MNTEDIKIEIQNLSMAYGSYVVMRDVSTRVKRGSIFVIMGERAASSTTAKVFGAWTRRPAASKCANSECSFKAPRSGAP